MEDHIRIDHRCGACDRRFQHSDTIVARKLLPIPVLLPSSVSNLLSQYLGLLKMLL